MTNTWEDSFDSWKTATPPEYSGHCAPSKPKERRVCVCGNTFEVRFADQAWCEFSRCGLKGARR